MPSVDYGELMSRARLGHCPALLLAPMENLADRPFRMAFAEAMGGFDEACTGAPAPDGAFFDMWRTTSNPSMAYSLTCAVLQATPQRVRRIL